MMPRGMGEGEHETWTKPAGAAVQPARPGASQRAGGEERDFFRVAGGAANGRSTRRQGQGDGATLEVVIPWAQ